MRLYNLLDRVFPTSYAAKFAVAAVLSAAVPVLGVAGYHVATGTQSALLSAEYAVLAALCLFGAALNLLCNAALLAPLTGIRWTLRSIHRERVYKPLPNHYRDDVGVTMRMSNRLAEDLGARLHGDVVSATIDPLTGSTLPEAFEEEMLRTGAGAVLVLTLPEYHRLCEEAGLDLTNRALSAVGRVLFRATRQGDLISRYQNGAFCVYLQGAGREVARHVADRIRIGVQEAVAEVLPDVQIHAGLAVRLPDEPVPAIWDRTVQAMQEAGPGPSDRVIMVPQPI